jgi:uncharacterized protein YvpB
MTSSCTHSARAAACACSFQAVFLLLALVLVSCQSSTPAIPFTAAPGPTFAAENTATPYPPTHTPTTAPTASTTPEPTLTPTATPLPAEFYIRDLLGHKQYFPLGCEAAVAVDWAAYFGVEINEFEFQTALPLSDNPELGFVGGVMGPWGQTPPYSYGVYAEPVAALLRQYGLQALAVKEYSVAEIRQQVANGKPVIAWVIGNCVGGIPSEYTDSQGNTVVVAAYEHVIIITGYNEGHLRYVNNGKYYEVPDEVFENSWGVLDNMAIIMQ